MTSNTLTTSWLALALLLVVSGCSTPSKSVEVTEIDQPYASLDISEPDFIVVENFAVTPAEVRLMSGISPGFARSFEDRSQTEEELIVGRTLSAMLKQQLVSELKARDIIAHPAEAAPRQTYKTGVIKGFFLEIDQGDRTVRNFIGFGLGRSHLTMRVIFNEREVTIAEATVATKTELKLGLLPVVAAFDEAARGTIENDARRAAKKIADEILAAYQRRGWRD